MLLRHIGRLSKGCAGIVGLALAAVQTTAAGTFSISPLRVELSAHKRIEALTVRNESDTAVVIQATAKMWTQVDGDDRLSDTHDAFATPAVVTIPGNGQQVIRVALRRDPDSQRELDYRLILQEVPPAAPSDFNGLQVSLRLSLPIFVAPLTNGQADVHWHARYSDDKQLIVSANNNGAAHLQVVDFIARFNGAGSAIHSPVSKYILPGSRVEWRLDAPLALRLTNIRLHVYSDAGEFDADVVQ